MHGVIVRGFVRFDMWQIENDSQDSNMHADGHSFSMYTASWSSCPVTDRSAYRIVSPYLVCICVCVCLTPREQLEYRLPSLPLDSEFSVYLVTV
jgi:hypothetical protein